MADIKAALNKLPVLAAGTSDDDDVGSGSDGHCAIGDM
jgi:hypothetical protein